MKWAINSLFKPPALSFRPQKSAKTRCIYNINMRKMIIIDWIKKSSIKCWQRDSYNTKIEVGPTCTKNAYTCGRVPSRALSHKSTYTLNLFSVFHYFALMYKSDPPQCCYYISIFANIWYLIKLIHSIIIILCVFMFYKQRVLANFWSRKDSAICACRKRSGACYCAEHMKWAINSMFMPPALSFRPQQSAKTRCIYNINMRKMIIIDWIKKSSIKWWQRYSYNTKSEVGPTCTKNAYTCGRVLSSALSHKSTYTLNCFQYFTIWHLCTSRTHLNVAIISVYLPTFDID